MESVPPIHASGKMTANEDQENGVATYHYCSAQAFKGIIEANRLWLTNAFFMNDFMELEWFRRLSRSVAAEMRGLDANLTAFYDTLERHLLEGGYQNVYCACFSTVRDDLSQWRAYADDGRGVAISFDLRSLQEANHDQVGDWH